MNAVSLFRGESQEVSCDDLSNGYSMGSMTCWRLASWTPDREVRVIVLCSCARHFTLTVTLSAQEYKWVLANCQGNLTKCWGISIPSKRSRNTPSSFMLRKPG